LGAIVVRRKNPANAGLPQIDFLGQRLQQFRRGEKSADFAGASNRDRLFDHVVHVSLGLVGFLSRR